MLDNTTARHNLQSSRSQDRDTPSSAITLQKVVMVGLGYIGLPTGAVMADKGLDVVGVDINDHAIAEVNAGRIHIVEPGLADVVARNVEASRLRAQRTPEAADAFIIAVPTPTRTDRSADTSYVMSAADAIAPHLQSGNLVVLESTSPVGTTEAMVERLQALRPDLRFPQRSMSEAHDIFVAYCPERVLPGQVLEELVNNSRALGGLTKACARRAAELYSRFVSAELVETDVRSAELCKLAENAFRDVNIAYANELANVCEQSEIDVWEVIRLANRHPRVNILRPGPGVGGHCIAVDPYFIVEMAPDDTPLIQAARHVNEGRPGRVVSAIRNAYTNAETRLGRVPRLAILGLAFKPDIDDLRESPALEIAEHLIGEYTNVLVVEPHIRDLPPQLNTNGASLVDLKTAIETADIIAILVDHSAFRIAMPSDKGHSVISPCRDV